MFKSVKSKTIILTLAIFTVFNLVLTVLEVQGYKNFKTLKLEVLQNKVEKFGENLNFNINQLENNVKTVAMTSAGFYYYAQRDMSVLDYVIKDNFKNNNLVSVGGGIWFEPYKIDPSKKRVCSYASWNNNEIKLDKSCNSEEYNYLQKNWYTNVKNNYSSETKNDAVWTAPYFDEIGTKNLMVTVGAAIYDKNENFIGMVGEDWLLNTITNKLDDVKLTPNTVIVFADKKNDYIITVNNNKSLIGKSLKELSWYSEDLDNFQINKINNKKYITFLKSFDNGMQLIVNAPEEEVFGNQRLSIFYGLLLQIISAFIFAILIYVTLKRNINKPIDILMDAAREFGQGNFDIKIEIDKPKEFSQLAETVNTMSRDIKRYLENIKTLTFEKSQIESDLNIAKEIQTSSLPSVFPPFPDVTTLDLFATMKTAKQVGGDFYDFYFVDKSHIAFTIADVSGKGVPAALFMMKAKSVLKSVALSTPIVDTIMAKANNTICENNEKNLFVTVGMGIIDIETGDVVYINAGHNPPILKKSDEVKYLEVPRNIVLGVVEDMKFEIVKFKLNPLDSILLYTDGVTEANNENFELYGEERLLRSVKTQECNPKSIVNGINKEVLSFVNGVEQADDITMLAITYYGNENITETIHVPADIKELAPFISWLEDLCKKCAVKNTSKLLISAEEIFVNIAYYAYPGKLKEYIQDTIITFKYIKPLNEIQLMFSDSGIPYNPLEKEDPDITLGIDEKPTGGLGILMVKNMADLVDYEYKNKHNVLTMKFKI